MERILVTGGAGFLGSHLCKHLLDQGHKVICLDNLSTGSEKNIEELKNDSNFKLIHHDLTIPFHEDCDFIFNMASPASPPHYQKDPIQTVKTNVLGTINCLELATKLNIPILQASTSEVYGDPKVHPQPESYWGNINPIGIRSCYDEGKRCAETLLFDYHRQYKAKIKLVRIFNTYGPHMCQKDGRVISNFILQALNNQPITIYGEGKQTRSFCYVDDLIDGLIKMKESSPDFTGPVNLGNPTERTILELAALILKLTNSKSQIIFMDLPKDDPIRRKPLIDLAKKELSWSPKIDLEEGLNKTIQYFQ
jgi:UDP-glucuronate decarboxylase